MLVNVREALRESHLNRHRLREIAARDKTDERDDTGILAFHGYVARGVAHLLADGNRSA